MSEVFCIVFPMFGCSDRPQFSGGKFSRQCPACEPLLDMEDTPRALLGITHSVGDEGIVARLGELDLNEPALGRL